MTLQKMNTRYFNTYGPVNEIEHYVVFRHQLIADIVSQIEWGTYFTIYAPRQMGKTTLLRQLVEILQKQSHYLPIILSFGAFENASVEGFIKAFSQKIIQQLEVVTNVVLAQNLPTDFLTLQDFLTTLAKPEYKIIMLIDEFDGTPQAAISGLLQVWREIYLSQQSPRTFHSVVLIGLQNIATLNLGRSSPFNIARQIRLPEFTFGEVQTLLGQYTTETGQIFTSKVISDIFHKTGGQPFLVNRLAAILTEDIVTERTSPITPNDFETALNTLLRESNYNFETLVRHAREYREDVLNILFGAEYEFNLNDPLVHALHMHGIIASVSNCQIANPIYAKVLLAAFRPIRNKLQGAALVNSYDLRQHVNGNELQMDALLSRFHEFVERRGQEAFKVTPMPQEATGQYLLMAYLDLFVRQIGGDLFTEIDSGNGRLDLIVVYQGRRYIIETKIWRGVATFDQGVEQLENYLLTEGENIGYYVVFHARSKVYGKLTNEQLEFTVEREQVKIKTYLVRLGQLFDA